MNVIVNFIIAMVLSSTAGAVPLTCETWFTQPASEDLALDLSGMNESSREFVSRLKYLINDRRLLRPDVLKKVVASSQPINPIGEKAPTLALLPHRAALAALLGEELQWDRIRNAAQILLSGESKNQVREEAAVRKTEVVLMPVIEKTLPYEFKVVFEGVNSQALGVTMEQDERTKDSILKAYDIETGTEVAKVEYWGAPFNNDFVDAITVGGHPLVTTTATESDEVLTLDLAAKKVISSQIVPPKTKTKARSPMFPEKTQRVHFVAKNGKVAVAAYHGSEVYFIDPFQDQIIQQVSYANPNPWKSDVWRGADGAVAFSSRYRTPTYLMDPWSQQPLKESSAVSSFAIFTYQGQTYGIGERPSGPMAMINVPLSVVNFETGQISNGFVVDKLSVEGYIHLLDTFEQDGTVYGIINTNVETYVVDLLKGKVLNTLTQSGLKGQVKFNWPRELRGQLGFDFEGRHYLLATVHADPSDIRGRLVVIDPFSFKTMGLGLELENYVDDIHMLPPKDGKPRAVLSVGGQAVVVSLAQKI